MPFDLGDDPAAQFEAAVAAAMQAWRQPGVLDAIIDAGRVWGLDGRLRWPRARAGKWPF